MLPGAHGRCKELALQEKHQLWSRDGIPLIVASWQNPSPCLSRRTHIPHGSSWKTSNHVAVSRAYVQTAPPPLPERAITQQCDQMCQRGAANKGQDISDLWDEGNWSRNNSSGWQKTKHHQRQKANTSFPNPKTFSSDEREGPKSSVQAQAGQLLLFPDWKTVRESEFHGTATPLSSACKSASTGSAEAQKGISLPEATSAHTASLQHSIPHWQCSQQSRNQKETQDQAEGVYDITVQTSYCSSDFTDSFLKGISTYYLIHFI